MFFLILLFCFICNSYAQITGFGSCPIVNTMPSFDVNKYAGVWYENRRSIPNWFERGGKCVTANYTGNDNGSINVVNREISELTGLEYTIAGTATLDKTECANVTGCSKFIVEFPAAVIGKTRGPYWVIDTDYNSYSLVWSCVNILLNHFKLLWILTREQMPSDDLIQRVKTVIKEQGMSDVRMMVTDQKNCP